MGIQNPQHRVALVGGGPGSFIIGAAHKPAMLMDNCFKIVAGAFSSDPAKSLAAAPEYRVDPDRAYGSWKTMLEVEWKRPDGARVVVVGTPNHLHVPICKVAWEIGFHVVTDKPMSNDRSTAQELYDLVIKGGNGKQVFAVTHNYMRNPMAVMAAEMVRAGDVGTVHTVLANYHQGWLATALETEDQKQAKWRTNPELAGAGCFGDIAVHAFKQGVMMGGVVPKTISARLGTQVQGRNIDDHGFAYITCHGGAKIILSSSQVMHGHANDHWVEVCGTNGSLIWRQEDPDYLVLKRNGEPIATYQRNACKMTPIAASMCRVPGGHPEAYLEGFANVYRQVAAQIEAVESGTALPSSPFAIAPGIADGMMGNVFIERSQASSAMGGAEVPFDHPLFN